MTTTINSDRHRPLPSPPGITVQPVRLSVARFASLETNSDIRSLASISTSDSHSRHTSYTQTSGPVEPDSLDTSPPAIPQPRTSAGNIPSQDEPAPTPAQAKTTRTTAVIGRLTASLDSVKRDLKAERTQHEETLRNLSSAKQRIEALQSENNNLVHSRDTGARMLERREQKLTELRSQLDTEIRRREIAETSVRDMNIRLNEVLQNTKKEVADARDAKGLAESQYATLRGTFNGYKSDIERVKKHLKDQSAAREQDVNKIIMLEAVCDRQAAEAKRSEMLVNAMTKTLEGYKQQAIDMEKKHIEMEAVCNQMRWVMRLHKEKECTSTPPG